MRIHVFVSGRVQGVGYRFWTLYQARELGVSGWVRNLPDRRVEAVFEGDRAAVEQMVKWCHTGPSAAVVKDVAVEQVEPERIRGFEIRYY
ncbi:MAG: acylphosphatase [Xenococcaceae cyanobacterium]